MNEQMMVALKEFLEKVDCALHKLYYDLFPQEQPPVEEPPTEEPPVEEPPVEEPPVEEPPVEEPPVEEPPVEEPPVEEPPVEEPPVEEPPVEEPPVPPSTEPALMGDHIDPVTKRTMFAPGTERDVTNQNEFNSALLSNVDFINLVPGPTYEYTINILTNLNRPANKPLVIRTKPGSTTKATLLKFHQNKPISGLALVDLKMEDVLFRTGSNILIEGVDGWLDIQGQRVNGAPGTPIKNVVIRFCNCSDHWAPSASVLVHGLFMYNYEDLLMEWNIFDHDGWKPGATRALSPAEGGATIRKHNVYLANPGKGNIVVRNNLFSRASSHGIHLRAGGLLKDNLFIRNPIAWQYGYGADGYFESYGLAQAGRVEGNVAVGSDDINTSTGDVRGIFGWMTCCKDVVVDSNLAIIDNTPITNDAVFWLEQKYEIVCTISNNKAYQWDGGIRKMSSGVAAKVTEVNNSLSLSTYDLSKVNPLMTDQFIENLKANGIVPSEFQALMNQLKS